MVSIGEIIQRSYDAISRNLGVVDTVHKKIHQGKMYSASHDFGVVGSGGGTADILLQNPADNYAHLSTYNFNPDASPGNIKIYEAPTFSAAGNVLDTGTQNLNTIENSPKMGVTINPTVSDTGILLEIIGLTGTKKSSAESAKYQEWVLSPNTDYLIRFTNDSTADTSICVGKVGWYEN